MTKTLTLSQVTKTYRSLTALSGISLEVAEGERVALLGHNGAGKSTMMKIILGLIGFDSGDISVAGSQPGSAAARQRAHWLTPSAMANKCPLLAASMGTGVTSRSAS